MPNPFTESAQLPERADARSSGLGSSESAVRAAFAKLELLEQGTRSAQVLLLQKKLIAAGALEGKPLATYDQGTAAAVRKYQQAKGLEVDGWVGQQTWGALYGLKVPPGTELLKRAGSPPRAPSLPPAGKK